MTRFLSGLAACSLALSLSAAGVYAQTATGTMKTDSMHSDTMAKDKMKTDTMSMATTKKDCMQEASMQKDKMKKADMMKHCDMMK